MFFLFDVPVLSLTIVLLSPAPLALILEWAYFSNHGSYRARGVARIPPFLFLLFPLLSGNDLPLHEAPLLVRSFVRPPCPPPRIRIEGGFSILPVDISFFHLNRLFFSLRAIWLEPFYENPFSCPVLNTELFFHIPPLESRPFWRIGSLSLGKRLTRSEPFPSVLPFFLFIPVLLLSFFFLTTLA